MQLSESNETCFNYRTEAVSHLQKTKTQKAKSNKTKKDKETDIYTFKAPTVEEVAEYCSERGNNVDAERFVSYYTANGWRGGKNPMQDWRAAVQSWESNGIANEKKTAAPELAKSFENDEFYSRALAASRKRMEV